MVQYLGDLGLTCNTIVDMWTIYMDILGKCGISWVYGVNARSSWIFGLNVQDHNGYLG